ncbi:MAG: hypothetical protein M1840_000461 [Geoglossum simile]|nr:MAG: hypothetical protein M1840_000461 [Geoglossum simile]
MAISDSTGNQIGLFHNSHYHFVAIRSADNKSLTVTTSNQKGDVSKPTTRRLIFPNEITGDLSSRVGCDIYTGKVNWASYAGNQIYADNEMITLTIPVSGGFSTPVMAVWQWTVDSKGQEKKSEMPVQAGVDSNKRMAFCGA